MLSNGIEGYEKYLILWPSGPRADEAWWQVRVIGGHCGDFEGTEQEYEDIVEKFQAAGLKVARRTVTKYREALKIPSSRQRRDWTAA